MSQLMQSWVESANSAQSPFPLNNLPYGVFSVADEEPRCGVAIGDMILDVQALEREGILDFGGAFDTAAWNDFMALGKAEWAELRSSLTALLAKGSADEEKLKPFLEFPFQY